MGAGASGNLGCSSKKGSCLAAAMSIIGMYGVIKHLDHWNDGPYLLKFKFSSAIPKMSVLSLELLFWFAGDCVCGD
jgi:hypothetical protein